MDPTVAVEESLKYFQIVGADADWKWAQARIISQDTIEVWYSEIAAPIELRSVWSANPVGANLYNKERLPAFVFQAISGLETLE
ncbi:hypothetical protein SH580_04095 [Coraliomargarita algicola]|uniref:Uncharacterized protein n=1 Tax=Coraliomargarita algicola TaxID=3092156 RepID=A0ABZ0RN96_9BACT|nr:hypothetical protein [Coraliomargarita sp. J2-16]WPJ96886.1 hypothetical protein SH580_04095 [Coraliomargarita sp. J2-16]